MKLLLRIEGLRSGEQNMAIDRALLKCAERGELSSPLLRVYAWSPPAVSLGYHQDAASLDTKRLSADGIDVVRRPTGGAAVLHAQEWTYAVAGARGIPGLGQGFAEIYRSLAAAMVEALKSVGVQAHAGGDGTPESFVCFEALQGHEIAVGGRKLVGSAFRQTRNAFLQHGSLLTGSRHLDLVEYLSGLDERARAARREELQRRTVDLAELGKGRLGDQEFARALAASIARRIQAEVVELEQDPTEMLPYLQEHEPAPRAGRILP